MHTSNMTRDVSVGIAMEYGLDDWGSISNWSKKFFFSPQRPDRLLAHTASYTMDNVCLFFRRLMRNWPLISICVRGQQYWNYSSLPPYVFTARCLLSKHRDKSASQIGVHHLLQAEVLKGKPDVILWVSVTSHISHTLFCLASAVLLVGTPFLETEGKLICQLHVEPLWGKHSRSVSSYMDPEGSFPYSPGPTSSSYPEPN
jgi:hypothetical protein